MNDINVRRARENDLKSVLILNQKNVPMVSHVDETWLLKYLKEASLFGVAEVKEHFCGFIVGMDPNADYKSENFLWFKKNYSDFLYVDRLAVETAHQDKGVGKALYAYAESIARPKSNRITCEVNIRPANERSYRFHEKLGFLEVGQQETKGGEIRVAMLAMDLK